VIVARSSADFGAEMFKIGPRSSTGHPRDINLSNLILRAICFDISENTVSVHFKAEIRLLKTQYGHLTEIHIENNFLSIFSGLPV
jgi:hypothetical protein